MMVMMVMMMVMKHIVMLVMKIRRKSIINTSIKSIRNVIRASIAVKMRKPSVTERKRRPRTWKDTTVRATRRRKTVRKPGKGGKGRNRKRKRNERQS